MSSGKITVITADSKENFKSYLLDIWNYRDLVRAFITRDLKVRYKQTVLGVLWVLIQPLMTAGIFSIIFSRVAKIPSQGLPPLIFYLAASIPWACFTNAISQASGCLEASSGLIKKVYFPRIIVPISMVLGTTIDFFIGWITFCVTSIAMGYWTWLFIPYTIVLLLLQQCTAMGIGLFLGILNAQYRDIRYIIPFLIQMLMFATPIIYPIELLRRSHILGEWGEVVVNLNPMAGVIETYRALLSADYIPYRILGWNFLVAVTVLILGIIVFRRREDRIMDLL
jgi:lipopolysaccharide transport system permease protein